MYVEVGLSWQDLEFSGCDIFTTPTTPGLVSIAFPCWEVAYHSRQELSKRPVWLLITHKLGSEDEAELDICEACETSPHDGVSRRRVFCACQVAPEPSEFGEI